MCDKYESQKYIIFLNIIRQ